MKKAEQKNKRNKMGKYFFTRFLINHSSIRTERFKVEKNQFCYEILNENVFPSFLLIFLQNRT